ncbi:MAG: TlpA disulfide reductase family protein [Bacteroidota bacterium]
MKVIIFIASAVLNASIPFTQQPNHTNSTTTYLKTEDYNSWNELTSEFKGNVVYVDIWATWCKPCIEEFVHYPEVEGLVKNQPIKLLFLSIDRSKHEKKWRKRIEKYQLEGYHLIANRALQKDLWQHIHQQDTRVPIPRYLIIDQQGKIMDKDAPKPSEREALKAAFDRLIQ